jgi:hypothetical protein
MVLIRRSEGINLPRAALALVACCVTKTLPASESLEQLFGAWTNLNVNGHFGKDSPWLFTGVLSLRTTEAGRSSAAGQDFLLSGVVNQDAIGYRFDEHHSVYVGYAFQYTTPPLARRDTTENRAWEQHTFAMPTSVGRLQLRSRLEQRTVNIGPGAAVRFRELIGLNYPLDKSWSLVASNEAFINLNTVDWGPVAGFDQNRLFLGVGYQFDATFRTEIGYMNQYIDRDLTYDRSFNLVNLNFFVEIPE